MRVTKFSALVLYHLNQK